jgi:hypothetical protein
MNASFNAERPKSAFYHEPVSEKVAPTVPQRYSQSDMLRNYNHTRNSHGHLDYSLDGNTTSRSTEDLLGTSEKRFGGPAPKNGSANELRQAANRFHQELMKNYPKVRHSITSKEVAVPKYPRRASEDNFSRVSQLRATIATASNARGPRSHSAYDSASLNLGGENSMLSQLLKSSQNTVALNKIEEEAKNRKEAKNNSPPLIRSNSVSSTNVVYLRSPSTEPDSSPNKNKDLRSSPIPEPVVGEEIPTPRSHRSSSSISSTYVP